VTERQACALDRLTRAARMRNTSAMQNSPDDPSGTRETPNEAIYGRPVATLGIKVVVEMPAVLYVNAREVVSQLEDYGISERDSGLQIEFETSERIHVIGE